MKSNSYALSFLSILLVVFLLSALGGDIMAQGKYSLHVARLLPHKNATVRSEKPNWGAGLEVVLPLTRTSIFPAANFGLEYFNCYSRNESVSDPYYGGADIPTSQGVYRIYSGGRIGVNGNGILRLFIGGNFALAVSRIHTAYVIYLIYGEGIRVPERENLYSQTKTSFGYDLNAGCELLLADTFIFESGMRYIRLFDAPIQLDDVRAIPIASDYFQIYLSVGAFFHKTQNQQ